MLADTSIEVVLEMPLLFFDNVDIKFAELKKLTWKTYTINEALSIISWVKLIDKRKFAKVALDKNSEIFLVYVANLKRPITMSFYLSKTYQVQVSNEFTLANLQ